MGRPDGIFRGDPAAEEERPETPLDALDDEAWDVDDEDFDEPLWRRVLRKGWWAVTLLGGVVVIGVIMVALPFILHPGRSAPPGSLPLQGRAESGLEAGAPAPPLPVSEGAPTSPTAVEPDAPLPGPHITSSPARSLPLTTPDPTAPPAPGAIPEAPTRSSPTVAPPEAPGGTPHRSRAIATEGSERTFWVQVGAFTNGRYARDLAARLTREDYPVEVRRKDPAAIPWVVWVGGYLDRPGAEAARAALAGKGFPGFVVEEARQ